MDMFTLYSGAFLSGARCAVLAVNRKKKNSLYALCSDSALMVASHKHKLKCSTLMRSTEPANSHPATSIPMSLFYQTIFEPMPFNRDLTVFNPKDEEGPQGSF